MHDKLSQAVKLYDQLLSAQVTHPPRRSTTSTTSTYPSTLRQVGPDLWVSPPPVSLSTWVSPQTQPIVHAQIRPPSPRVTHTPPSFITSVSRPIGNHPAPLPHPTQVADSSILQTAPNQEYAPIPTSSHLARFKPIEADEVPMAVSPVKPPFPEPTHGRRSATPRPAVVQLGVGSSPPTSQFGDTGGLGLVDLDGREDSGESDGDELVPLSLAGEVAFAL